ncbi:polysaccharide lyase family 1 protein [Piromyces sp. E2]|nr:polysaccharide lyase family 1 protein [Piromyces sp. E2]|eukprot:OUM68853.1 polysaccharide lyase family 1 protein [Piromyces sp. E2]
MLSKKNFQFIFTLFLLYYLTESVALCRNISFLKRNHKKPLISSYVDSPKDRRPIGFGRNTIGGDVENSTVYNVYNLKEFFDALDNQGHPDDPKIIYVNGKIQGNIKKTSVKQKRDTSSDDENSEAIENINENVNVEELNSESEDDLEIQYMTESDYAPGYSITAYLSCFGEDGKNWENSDYCNQLEELRLQGHETQKEAIMLRVGNNTSIYGVNEKSHLQDIFLNIRGSDQVIVRHLTVDTPRDFFSEWDPTDGVNGSWNAAFTGIAIENS